MRRLPAVLIALPMTFALTGCSEQLDVANAEREIAAGYARQAPGADVTAVECPEEVSADLGTEARCTITQANDIRLDVDVEVTGEDGRIRWEIVGGTAPDDLIEPTAVDVLAKQVGQRPDGVDCPDRVSLEVGATTRCTLTAGEQVYGMTITITDSDGDFDIAVDEQPTT